MADLGGMEISLLKSLLNNIISFSQLASCEGIKCEPVEKYHQKTEERLKLLKPILDVIVDAEIASDEMLQKAFAGLYQSVDELREIFEKWQPLMSKVYFVLQVESLMTKIETLCLEIPELLKSSDQFLAAELHAASLQHCVQKIKHMGHEQTSSLIMKAIKDHVDGSGASSESLSVLADSLSLKSIQEVLIDAVALEKLKETAEHAGKRGEVELIDHMIALVTHMHDHLVMVKLSQTCSPVPIPAYFFCPLSLEIMVDPVIIASGQTYDRAFIQKWIDLGFTVCPKTRQALSHTCLTPNNIVKGLIAKWHESNNIKLLDPTKYSGARRANQSTAPDPTMSLSSPRKSTISLNGFPREGSSASHPRSLSEDSLPGAAVNENDTLDTGRISMRCCEDRSDHSGERSLNTSDKLSTSPSRNSAAGADEHSSYGHNQTNIAACILSNSNISQGTPGNGNEVASHAAAFSSDASGELMSESQPAANLRAPPREPNLSSQLETGSQGQTIGPEASERFVPSVVSSPAVESRADLLEVDTEVRKLVEDLRNTSLDAKRNATAELRLLAKHDTQNRILIANCGAISLLVNLLHSADSEVQENAVTTLLNLSINVENKTAIANADAIEPLIHVLETGSVEAKQNSAATLFSLSEIEENKIKIGRSRAIKPLADLLGNGTPGSKKDALKALFRLSKFHQNQIRIVEAGAVQYLVDLIDPAEGMVDKAVALLSNLATTFEGRTKIGQHGGIPILVEVVELGSARAKENAAAALLQLCTKSGRYCKMALLEGAIPPLVALSLSGTTRAKEKARALLICLRNQRPGN
ncbi:U-box domain-containing protein 4 [Forsythia ovata]|uniref:RING-type E3 ubiquitin transferase n=1 Tax=Forsythia ovata TaxID=205694 RepID=A0ABD1W7B4_9LAMI